MPKPRKYAIVFSSDMMHPLYITADNAEDFFHKFMDIVMKYGEFEFVYRVY